MIPRSRLVMNESVLLKVEGAVENPLELRFEETWIA